MGLRVIGAGLGRTGTLSLKRALERLGFGPCHHMEDIITDQTKVARWLAVRPGSPTDWAALFAGYHSTVDFPSVTYWRELSAAFPEAKVVLTMRDPDAWFDSTQKTVFSTALTDEMPKSSPFFQMADRHIITGMFAGDVHTRAHCIEIYQRHNALVQATIPAERLLVYHVASGWRPLCAFLGVAVPDGPFPSANSTDEFRAETVPQIG